jgi:hypothetical protein
MPLIPRSGEAGPRRGLASKLVAAVRAVSGTALVCAAAAGCAPATDRYDPPLPAAAVPERFDAPRPAGAAARTGTDGPAGAAAPLGGMGEAVEGHRERRW